MRKVAVSALIVLAMLMAMVPASGGTITEGHSWGLDISEGLYAIDSDSSGNVYIAGVSTGPGSVVGFIAKFDRSGSLVWDRTLNVEGSVGVYDIAVDDSGNSYVCGNIWLPNESMSVGYVAKIDSTGALVFDRILSGFESPWEIELDSQGFVVAGDWESTTGIAAFTSSGVLRWAVHSDWTVWGLAYGLAVDANDNVFIIMDRQMPSDVGIAMFDSNGNLVKQVAYQSSYPDEYSWDIAIGANGNLYALGWSISEALLVLMELTPTLDFVWGEEVGNPESSQECWKIVAQPDGTICAIGNAVNASDWTSGASLFKLSSSGALLEASYYPTSLGFGDAVALPFGGLLIGGTCYGPVDLTDVALPGISVISIPDLLGPDSVLYQQVLLSYSSGVLWTNDPVAYVDSYDPALGPQAWFGYVDAVTSQFPVDVSVRQSTANPSHVTLRAVASGGNRPYTYTWNFGDGTSGTGQRVTHNYATAGNFHATVVAVDSIGQVGLGSADVLVPGPPIIDELYVTPSSPLMNQVATFYAYAYDPDGGPLAYAWGFGDGSPSIQTSIGVVDHIYTAAGQYQLVLFVADDEGFITTAFLSFEVIEFNNPPVALFTVTPASGNTTVEFTVDASSSYDFEDPQDVLQVRWDWEGDGFWDTNWTTDKLAYHSYSEFGVYTILMEVADSKWLTNWTSRQVTVSSGDWFVHLYETFDSYSSIDPNWTFLNAYPWYNTIGIENGTLYSTNSAGWEVNDAWNSRANWTKTIEYDGTMSISFSIYLPTDSDYKEGNWGQWEALVLYDESGREALIMRWLMDIWSGAPSGWSYIDSSSVWANVCSFTAGWHEVQILMDSDTMVWTGIFDGTVYPGQTYTGIPSYGFSVSRLGFVNALREEVTTVEVDNLEVKTSSIHFPQPNMPPVAKFTASPQYLHVGESVTFDASQSYDPDGNITEYGWDFGDGTEGGGVLTAHPYYSVGTYTVTLTVWDEDGETDNASTNVVVLEEGAQNNWTVLVYIDGDNNLEEVALIDFMEMSSVGSTDAVNIAVQLDRTPSFDSSYGDWTGTKRFYVAQGMTPTPENALMDLGEQDMGDPATLTDFLEWGMMSFPADRYLVVLWDHGGGWDGAVCWDDTDGGDALTLNELQIAFNSSEMATGEWIDMIGFDACLMGMAEVAYEIRDYTDVLVFSEETIPWDGWPYDTIMSDLVLNPFISPADLSSSIVTRYAEFYGYYGSETLSSVSVAAMKSDLYPAIDALAKKLMETMPSYNSQIIDSWAASEFFSYNDYIDLYDFATEIENRIPWWEVQAAAVNLTEAINASIIANFAGQWHPGAYGLSIYLAPIPGWYLPSYDTLDMSVDLAWDDFIKSLGTVEPDIYEPDDTSMDAKTILPGMIQWHSIDDGGLDVDWVTFELTETTQVRLNTSGTYGDTVLYLYNQSGLPYWPIAMNDDYNGTYWSQITAWLGPGTYWAQVTSYDNSSAIPLYGLALSYGPFPTEPPYASFYWYGNPYVGGNVYFDAYGSEDPDGYIVDFSWDFGDGSTGSGPWVEHVFYAAGDYLVMLNVTDNDGLTATTWQFVYISGPSEPPVPVAMIWPENPAPGETVTFDGSMSYDPDGYITNWFWYFGDGYYTWGAVAYHSYPTPGTYIVRLEVYDNVGLWSYAEYSITVREWMPTPPVAVIAYEPSQALVGEVVMFDGNYSLDPDGYIVNYIWQFGDGDVGFGVEAYHAYEHPGTYSVSLNVMDQDGLSDEAVTTIQVVSRPTAAFEYSPLLPMAGVSVSFYAWGSYDESGIVEYLWSFGDGAYASGWQVSHVFASAGPYSVTLIVRNTAGVQANCSEIVTVTSAQSLTGALSSGGGITFSDSPPLTLAWLGLVGFCAVSVGLAGRLRRR